MGPGLRRDDVRRERAQNKKGRIVDPALLLDLKKPAPHAAFSNPSLFSASCTFGRAAMRAL
jgi:hypothetical protein